MSMFAPEAETSVGSEAEQGVFIPEPGAVQEPPPPPTAAELKKMRRVFKDARDCWKIDGATMKSFYLHSESGYLYCWDQPTGMLYEYAPSTGQCQAVWTSAVPQLNAELWTVLPLPPTDPASLQASIVESGQVPNIDAFINLIVAHEAGHHVPSDVLEAAVEDFTARFTLQPQAVRCLEQLPPAGQCFAIQNFRLDDNSDASQALVGYIVQLQRKRPPPWGNSACTLRVEATGAIIGRCCADLDALCRSDPPERLAQAHCRITSEEDRFFICDLNTAKEGTLLDGFAVSDAWVGPLKSGSLLIVGPLRIKIQLSDMAKDTYKEGCSLMKRRAKDDDDAEWKRKVFQRTPEWEKADQKRRQEQYKDRAEERRMRDKSEAGSAAIDGLVNKFEQIRQAERIAEEQEEARVEMPLQESQREANMRVDGSFVGFGEAGLERAGIGFNSSASAQLIPNVVDPSALSREDASRLKTQMRFQQANSR